MPVSTEVAQSGFSFKVVFLDEDEQLIDSTTIDILVDATDDREDDRDQAYSLADDEAEKRLEDYSAESFEIILVDAY